MASPRNLIRHLRQCHETRGAPRIEAADAKLWFLAISELIRLGALDEAAHAAPLLAAAFPNSHFLGRLAMLLDRMPAAVADPAFLSFANDEGADVQVCRRAGATTVLLAFCGRGGSLGIPLPIAHRWFGVLGVHVVYLRDPVGEIYVSGIPAIAGDLGSTLRGLEAIVGDLGGTRTVCYGNSNGGYAALLYGLKLRAAGVICVNTKLIFPIEEIVPRSRDIARRFSVEVPDVASLYGAATVRPRVRLVHAAGNAEDAASAATMTGIPGVTIEAVPGCDGHDAHTTLIEQGGFLPLLRHLVADRVGTPGGAVVR